MLHRPMSRALLSGAAFLSLAIVPGPAPADTFLETVYLPTSSVVGLPSSSVLATSYIVPTTFSSTSYVVPTAYSSTILPTSSVITAGDYVVPTSTYYRRSFFRPRRFVERTRYTVLPTSYVSPTSYVLPTSYVVPTGYFSSSSLVPTSYVSSYFAPTSYVVDNGVIATSASSYPCETTSSPAPPRSSAGRSTGGNSIVSEPTNGGPSNERRPSAVLNSTPGGEEGTSSNVNPRVPAEVPPPARPLAAEPVTPPAAPLPEPDPARLKLPEPGAQPTPNETMIRSRVRRPAYDVRNILRGRVISAESRQPEEGVSVVIASLTNNYGDRNALTDADGEFKVSLPDGDWTVKVKMPGGTIYPVGRDSVTASNGRVTDSSGRSVGEFLITR